MFVGAIIEQCVHDLRDSQTIKPVADDLDYSPPEPT